MPAMMFRKRSNLRMTLVATSPWKSSSLCCAAPFQVTSLLTSEQSWSELLSLVFGASALYLCLPGQHDEAQIHRIQIDDVHKDVLAEHDKLSRGKYKGGTMEKPDGFDEAVEAEQDMIQRSMNRYSEFGKVQDYIAQVNGEIEASCAQDG